MYDTFTSQYGLNNLIWVLGYSGEVRKNWYPGDEYVDILGSDTYDGSTNQNGNGTKICVTQNSTLVLKQVSNNLTVYLAPNATLDLTQVSGTATFQNSHAAIFLNSGSQVKAGSLKIEEGGSFQGRSEMNFKPADPAFAE